MTIQSNGHEHELALGGGPGDAHPGEVATCGTDQREDRLCERDAECDNQCEMSQFWNHERPRSGRDEGRGTRGELKSKRIAL